jgi:predicted  nucleic acid-binding Zn-ribbon protein
VNDVSSELMFELLKRIQNDLSSLKDGQKDMRQDMLSLRNQFHLLQGDVNTMRGSIVHIDDRLERIENRLELRELAEAQSRFEPHP